jgi:phosphoglycerol transferase
MFGSISSYGGKQNYFLQHGTDKVLDYKTAVKDNFIPEDYFTWWGFEDKKLFEYAKQELTKLSKSEKPFAFTMLTADTHHIEGYKCEDCENTFDNQYQNVLRCSSKQVLEFVNWIKQQDFYKNTTIVIVGDHLSMNAKFFRTNADKDYTRRVYNCFINAKATTENSKNRVFTPMDIFPTTLAALGCEIKGDRLGLGTNLFSATPTLAEKMSLEKLDNEINKASDYYYDTFIKTK